MTMEPQEKWQANMEKVAFAKRFPGLLHDWSEAKGKRILSIIQLTARPGQVILFDDRTFLVAGLAGLADPDPAHLIAGLFAAETPLRDWYPDAFARLVGLRERDDQLTQQARVEKIAGAIRHNAGLPGLKEAVARALKDVSESNKGEKD
ncbi:MAG: hypothetical protein HY208_08055 [Nitrospirae bacterium]|nr:hypothetical protein [Nitrospirota bacterium]